jgi:hypothetical protein
VTGATPGASTDERPAPVCRCDAMRQHADPGVVELLANGGSAQPVVARSSTPSKRSDPEPVYG